MKLQVFLLVSCVTLSAFADFKAIPFRSCGEGFDATICNIESVKVDECELDRDFCELIRGETYQMDMRFTPSFEGSNLTVLAYALIGGKPVAWNQMNSKACDYMDCPIKQGVPQSYIFNVNVPTLSPRGKFIVRWLMKQGDEDRCCFTNKFELI